MDMGKIILALVISIVALFALAACTEKAPENTNEMPGKGQEAIDEPQLVEPELNETEVNV